jgi:hypothetical protein
MIICTDLDPYIIKQKQQEKPSFLLFCDFLRTFFFKTDVNVSSKVISKKTLENKTYFLFGILKATDEKI